MMIPIPAAGVLRHVAGIEAARALVDIDELEFTIEPGVRHQMDEGSLYVKISAGKAKSQPSTAVM